jgi:putative molybdopterin biosynthesis protein
MAEYMTTKEVAAYLRINEKKIYALVADGQLPASRVSGKWLFPKHVIDNWVERNTRYPSVGLMGALLDDVLIIQGSDDWLFSHIAGAYQATGQVSVVSAAVGSIAGLSAVNSGTAHMAGCHVDNAEIAKFNSAGGFYLVNLFSRIQGLLYDGKRNPEVTSLGDVVRGNLVFASRQPLSGTHRITEKMLLKSGISLAALTTSGPYSSHLDLALAIRNQEADVGIGTLVAARQCGLDFIALHTEPFKLVIPASFASQPQVMGFIEFLLKKLRSSAKEGVEGYDFSDLGRMETIATESG